MTVGKKTNKQPQTRRQNNVKEPTIINTGFLINNLIKKTSNLTTRKIINIAITTAIIVRAISTIGYPLLSICKYT
jgi:hypothetical protein